jgi:multiple sugar transport system ATP-binding protein
MAGIEFINVSKRYGDGTEAVRNLDLAIGDGELMILVGPSGCGKTTALRMIAGLEMITSGELRIDGELVNDVPPRKRDIAMVFQSYALYPHMNVAQNMGFALKIARTPKERIRAKVGDAATLLDLEEQLRRKPGNLSGGQRQRVAMGRAIVRNPKAFLMDEPLSNLDATLRVQMRAEIVRIQRSLGVTTLYVTHDQIEAMTLGDRIAVMRAGVLQQVGAPRELYDRPVNLFVAGFIGAPAMNLLPGSIDGDTLRLPLAEIPLDAGLRAKLNGHRPGGGVVVGIRPEDFAETPPSGDARAHAISAPVDVLETTGSDVYAHLLLEGADGDKLVRGAAAPEEPAAVDRSEIVARLDAASTVREGAPARLWVDAAKLHLFDAETGLRLGGADG